MTASGAVTRRPSAVAGLDNGDRHDGIRASATGWSYAGILLLVVATGAALAVAVQGDHVDLEVYRRAGERWLSGADPYAVRPELAFTYPPLAAVLSALVALAPSLAAVVLGVATAGAAAWATTAVWPSAGPALAGRPVPGRAALVPVVAALALVSEPVLRGLQLGQVNGLVVGLVLLDLLVVPDRHRGWLTGLAAGLKLTPLVFVLHLAVRKDWPAVCRLLGGFGLTVVVGAVAAPGTAMRFWTQLVVDPHRVGDPGFVDNQSLLGAATRLVPAAPEAAWVASSVAVVALAVVVLRLHRPGPRLVGVVVCGLVGLLVSPVSWSHHWLLLPAAGLLCWRAGHRLVGGAAVAVAVLAPHWRLADVPLAPTFAALAGSSMALVAVACLLALARPATHPPAPAEGIVRRGRSAQHHESTTPNASPVVHPFSGADTVISCSQAVAVCGTGCSQQGVGMVERQLPTARGEKVREP